MDHGVHAVQLPLGNGPPAPAGVLVLHPGVPEPVRPDPATRQRAKEELDEVASERLGARLGQQFPGRERELQFRDPVVREEVVEARQGELCGRGVGVVGLAFLGFLGFLAVWGGFRGVFDLF